MPLEWHYHEHLDPNCAQTPSPTCTAFEGGATILEHDCSPVSDPSVGNACVHLVDTGAAPMAMNAAATTKAGAHTAAAPMGEHGIRTPCAYDKLTELMHQKGRHPKASRPPKPNGPVPCGPDAHHAGNMRHPHPHG